MHKIAYISIIGTESIATLIKDQTWQQDPLPDDPDICIITDIRFADIEFNLDDIKEMINYNQGEMSDRGYLLNTAVLTYRRTLSLLGEAFQLMGDHLPIKLGIYSNLHQALEWLGKSELEPIVAEKLAELAKLDNPKA